MVDNFSHVSPFESTHQAFIINLKTLKFSNFIIILLLFLVQLVYSSKSSLFSSRETFHERVVTVSNHVFSLLIFLAGSKDEHFTRDLRKRVSEEVKLIFKLLDFDFLNHRYHTIFRQVIFVSFIITSSGSVRLLRTHLRHTALRFFLFRSVL